MIAICRCHSMTNFRSVLRPSSIIIIDKLPSSCRRGFFDFSSRLFLSSSPTQKRSERKTFSLSVDLRNLRMLIFRRGFLSFQVSPLNKFLGLSHSPLAFPFSLSAEEEEIPNWRWLEQQEQSDVRLKLLYAKTMTRWNTNSSSTGGLTLVWGMTTNA